MAQLPPDGEYVMQQIDGSVVLFNRNTEEELVRFNPMDANECAIAQGAIASLTELDTEQKSFAHFWSGYFYGCAH